MSTPTDPVQRLAEALDFAVFGLGRCGTTWTAAWLSRYADVLHDPILFRSTEETAEWAEACSRPAGIVCTASWLVPGFVEALRERGKPVVLLARRPADIDASYRRIGLGGIPEGALERWEALAKRDSVPYLWIFNPDYAGWVLRYLCPRARFDASHHAELRAMKIEPAPQVIESIKRLMEGHERRYDMPHNPTGRPE